MAFGDRSHRRKIKKLDLLWHSFDQYAKLAAEYEIDDIFQDNNAKLLQQLIYMDMRPLKGREGNDAIDEFHQEWEMKSANAKLVQGFSTHHHLNEVILEKYRQVPWMFSIYENIILLEIYVMPAKTLESIFLKWEAKLRGSPSQDSINNPKIPIAFVRANGFKVYPFAKKPVNPALIVRQVPD